MSINMINVNMNGMIRNSYVNTTCTILGAIIMKKVMNEKGKSKEAIVEPQHADLKFPISFPLYEFDISIKISI